MVDWDLHLRGLPGIGLIEAGTDLAAVIAKAADQDGLQLLNDDVIVVAQKVVSKAEGRVVDLASVTVSDRARRLAEQTGRTPAFASSTWTRPRRCSTSRAGTW